MNQEQLYTLLKAPVVSEKAALATETANQYVFKVAVDATKPQVKAAVELAFSVTVESVRIANVKGKARRTKHGIGRRSDWKKAYVNLADGQEIDVTEV